MKRRIRDLNTGEDQTTPYWAVKEDDRLRREDRADPAEGYHYVWSVIFALLPPLVLFAWRLVA